MSQYLQSADHEDDSRATNSQVSIMQYSGKTRRKSNLPNCIYFGDVEDLEVAVRFKVSGKEESNEQPC